MTHNETKQSQKFIDPILQKSDLFDYWRIPWQDFDVLLSQRNSSSLRGLNIDSNKQAEFFLQSCGFDPKVSNEQKQFDQIFGEALFFIRHTLLTEKERNDFVVPSEILYLESPQALILLASSSLPRKRYKRTWACALLKVMSAIANVQFSERLHFIDEVREQIFKRIKNYLTNTNDLNYEIKSDNYSLQFSKVEWKEAKTRTSIILKLLHKSDSAADDVFDYLGIRFVTKQSNEIPMLIKILIEKNIIIPHQVVTGRTRNSLIQTKNQHRILNFLQSLYSCGSLTNEEFDAMCRKLNWNIPIGEEQIRKNNHFSSQHYRSLQFTIKHFVRIQNPAFLVLKSLINQLSRYTGSQRQEPWLESVIPESYASYFPIEIQIMDQESYDTAKFGPASHEQYKAQQLKAIRERICGTLLHFTHEKINNQEL